MKRLKIKMLVAIAGLLTAHCSLLTAADAVEPASITITNFRSEAVNAASSETFYKGTTLLFTNCIIYAGTDTNSAKQGLSGVTIELKIGNTTTAQTYNATVQSTNGGTWWCSTTVPTNSDPCYIQVKCTDSVATNSYINSWKNLNRKDAM